MKRGVNMFETNKALKSSAEFLVKEMERRELAAKFFKAVTNDDLDTVCSFLEEQPGWATGSHPIYRTRPYEAAKSVKMLLLLMKFGADKAAINAHLQTLPPEERTRRTMDFVCS